MAHVNDLWSHVFNLINHCKVSKMPAVKQLSRVIGGLKSKSISWHPGHMYGGMQAIIGKLNTVDCVIEVHDARIPFTGRNKEFKRQLGAIKPHVLVLNKRDLTDLSNWHSIKDKLKKQGDENVILTDLSGSDFSFFSRGYNSLMNTVVNVIYSGERYNRQSITQLKVMIVGIPNVGKSTLINRLRQHHIGKKGEPAKAASFAGVTRSVQQTIKICSRPPIYSIDTPGILQPSATKNHDDAMRLALCSTISDKVVNPATLAKYLLDYLNKNDNDLYLPRLGLDQPVKTIEELVEKSTWRAEKNQSGNKPDSNAICWKLVRDFRLGCYGLAMFDDQKLDIL